MLVNANEGARAHFGRDFDVCVVGAGPAGITLARSLAGKGLDVALMEAGDLHFSSESQDIYRGEYVGTEYLDLDLVRLRYFGGTSGHWNGTCRTLDAYDFEPLEHRPWSWPITKKELDSYQRAAAEILEIEEGLDELPDLPLAQSEKRFRQIQWRHSPPVRFGDKYFEEIAASQRITLCLNANLVDLRLDNLHTTVTGAEFRSYERGDPGFSVRARAYCLCTGAIENARLLLNFRQRPRGIGNDHGLVGRYFCEHLYLPVGYMVFAEPLPRRVTSFAPALDFMKRERILNFALVLFSEKQEQQSFYEAAKESAKCFDSFSRALTELLRGYRPSCKSQGGIEEFHLRYEPDRYPYGWARIATEQALDASNRVELSEERDAFGLRRARLKWRTGEQELRTAQVAALALGAHMAEQNVGRLRIDDWALSDPVQAPDQEMNGSYHHMCTTRMSDDPRHGVVNAHCRVHGLSNLYLGGSSVFATPGLANPTLTIVQLALRLGDHLEGRLRGGADDLVVRPRPLEHLAP